VPRLDEVILEVTDAGLRARLLVAAAAAIQRTTLGLNFERHLPEYVALPSAQLKLGDMVALRNGVHAEPLRISSMEGDKAICTPVFGDKEPSRLPLRSLVSIKKIGESVFPCLRQVESVASINVKPHHVLIEGENHGVLQLLAYTHARRVDCVYIDPPYNTGAKDWRYNNNFVDKNDAFRSSKWLSMMERRLRIARQILKPDGVLVVAIDDYEYAHLVTMLASETLFRGWTIETVVIQHNPRGGGGNHISNTHEYAVFVVPPGRGLSPIALGKDELRDYRRRGRGDNNRRSGRPKSFFAIHVDPTTREVVGVGPDIPREAEYYDTGPTPEGYLRIYPMGNEKLERVWRNSREAVRDRIIDGTLTLRCTARNTIVQVIGGAAKTVPVMSIWNGQRYNAGEQGTNLVQALTGVEFPYPKSIYTVLDCLKAVVGKQKDAVILDFFGGSGTTMHATALLNAADEGDRQCILVTNNEVGEPSAINMSKQGLQTGDETWEAQGICRSVTYPRMKSAITGRRANVSVDWEIFLGQKESREVPIDVQIMEFIGAAQAKAPVARASLAPFLSITQKALRDAWPYYIPPAEGSRDPVKGQAVLFDPESLNEFIAAVSEADHIQRIFLASSGNSRMDGRMVRSIHEGLGPRVEEFEIARNVSAGLKENLSYMRLEYLDPDAVEVGRHLNDLVPTLWLMAGGLGAVPLATGSEGYLIPDGGAFALLVNEARFKDFRRALARKPHVTWAFLITDSDEAFQEMSAMLPRTIPATQRRQLYRDYLNNFSINLGDR
jgi:adenine-specific DNA-methyltransferase